MKCFSLEFILTAVKWKGGCNGIFITIGKIPALTECIHYGYFIVG